MSELSPSSKGESMIDESIAFGESRVRKTLRAKVILDQYTMDCRDKCRG